jgi:dTDP-4-dehydrorhamnose 3,5-epimerase
MDIINLRLEGLKLIRPRIFQDERGFFKESFSESRYDRFVQDNHSFSKKNVIRGMHFQSEPGQGKLVWVVVGKIFDVAVDLRKDSATFGEWEGIYLDGESQEQLFIPAGFAHGFCVISDEGAHVNYKVTTPYDGKIEKTFRHDDPQINIQWPIETPILSSRDRNAPYFKEIL